MNLPRFLVLGLFGLLQVADARAALAPNASNGAVPPWPGAERFLFIVDISAGMEDLQAANEATLYDLLRKGIDGQMQTGDTYGLWTFNKETKAGQFPMRVWEAKKAMQQGTIAAAFIN